MQKMNEEIARTAEAMAKIAKDTEIDLKDQMEFKDGADRDTIDRQIDSP